MFTFKGHVPVDILKYKSEDWNSWSNLNILETYCYEKKYSELLLEIPVNYILLNSGSWRVRLADPLDAEFSSLCDGQDKLQRWSAFTET